MNWFSSPVAHWSNSRCASAWFYRHSKGAWEKIMLMPDVRSVWIWRELRLSIKTKIKKKMEVWIVTNSCNFPSSPNEVLVVHISPVTVSAWSVLHSQRNRTCYVMFTLHMKPHWTAAHPSIKQDCREIERKTFFSTPLQFLFISMILYYFHFRINKHQYVLREQSSTALKWKDSCCFFKNKHAYEKVAQKPRR